MAAEGQRGNDGSGTAQAKPTPAEPKLMAEWLRLFIEPGQVTELRALKVSNAGFRREHTEAGYFDFEHLLDMARCAFRITQQARGVYFTLNPVNSDLLARRCNRIAVAEEGQLTKDKDILRRRWLLVDADPVRDPYVSATDGEKSHAFSTIGRVRAHLRGLCWPDPILADSGNGYHLLYRIDLPVDDNPGVERILQVLAQHFNSSEVKIDVTVFNPARICKMPGTLARKGDSTKDRPHRRACSLEAPTGGNPPQPVPVELLKDLASAWHEPARVHAAGPRPSANGAPNGEYRHRLLVEAWLRHRGVSYRIKDGQASGERTIYLLDKCPFDESHGPGKEVCIMQAADGKMSAKCMHDSCTGRGWQEFKQAIGKPDPKHYDPPMIPGVKLRSGRPRATRAGLGEGPAPPPSEAGTKGSDWESIGENAPPPDGLPFGVHVSVNEADNDPHRLARLYYERQMTSKGPGLRFWRGEWYRWGGGVYRVVDGKELRAEVTARVKEEFDDLNTAAMREYTMNAMSENGDGEGEKKKPPVALQVTTKLVGNVIQALEGYAMLSSRIEAPAWIDHPEAFDDPASVFVPPFAPGETIAFPNGLLHLPSLTAGDACETPCFVDTTPHFFSPNVMDYEFAHEAPEPLEWLGFLAKVWPDDQEAIDTLQEWFGYCLLPDTRQQKILLVVGPRRSGKGTIARVLRGLIGIDNTAGPTLGGLGTNFGLWPLLGKTLAIISDARLSGRTDAAVVTERLLSISGEDAQTIDRKNLPQVTTQLAVRFVIMTNELPTLNDPSGALTGRMIILRQTRSWYGQEDASLTDRLLKELSGIFHWSVGGWRRLHERGHFLQPESARKLLTDLEDLSSPIGAFLRECCEVRPGSEVFVRDLFERWKNWCEAKGHRHVGSEASFGRDLRAAVPSLDSRQPCVDGRRIRVYVGIGLRQEGCEGGDS